MPIQCSVYIATSLDGFIARENGDLDWLDKANEWVPNGEDCGFSEFMDSVDALVMGRKTFEKVLSFGIWPYGETPVYVYTKKGCSIPVELSDRVCCRSEEPVALVRALEQNGLRRLYIDGGQTIQSFFKADLIDDMTITTIPVLLGKGLRLFGELEKDIWLRKTDIEHYEFGFVKTTYDVAK